MKAIAQKIYPWHTFMEDKDCLLSQIELLGEQIASLKQILLYEQQEGQELAGELSWVNQELAEIHWEMKQILGVKQVSFEQAKKFAKIILAEEKTTTEALAKLLSVIYGQPVSLGEIGGIPTGVQKLSKNLKRKLSP